MSFKRFNICLFFLSFMIGITNAQVRFGIKAGMASYDVLEDSLSIMVPQSDPFSFVVDEIKFGYFGGLVLQANIKGFLIQPELVYNYNVVTYKIANSAGLDGDYREEYHYIDFPILFGIKAGPLRLNAGPIAHYFMKNQSTLEGLEVYTANFNQYSFGYQAGIGLDFWKILLDIRFESNFSKFGNHITFYDQPYQFQDNTRRLMASVSFVF